MAKHSLVKPVGLLLASLIALLLAYALYASPEKPVTGIVSFIAVAVGCTFSSLKDEAWKLLIADAKKQFIYAFGNPENNAAGAARADAALGIVAFVVFLIAVFLRASAEVGVGLVILTFILGILFRKRRNRIRR